MQDHIYPIFDVLIKKEEKEKLLKQKSLVIWMVGLSGSGKSTLAKALAHRLHEMGYLTQLLDGDNLRAGLNQNLGFSQEDRMENIRRTAELAKLSVENGLIVICSFISPLKKMRTLAKNIIGKSYFEVYLDCPLALCESRDVKGLYQKARKGEIKDFTGIDAPFEVPQSPSLVVNTEKNSIEQCQKMLLDAILPQITYEKLQKK